MSQMKIRVEIREQFKIPRQIVEDGRGGEESWLGSLSQPDVIQEGAS